MGVQGAKPPEALEIYEKTCLISIVCISATIWPILML